jgi:hypothetical protein
MDRYVHSVNEVSEIDREGYRTLKLRNLGMVEHVDTVIRGDKVDASKNSPIWFVSDSIGVGESEMIPCEVSQDFSMSMIA